MTAKFFLGHIHEVVVGAEAEVGVVAVVHRQEGILYCLRAIISVFLCDTTGVQEDIRNAALVEVLAEAPEEVPGGVLATK